MLANPFTPNSPAPIHAFVNRAREIDLIFGHLRAVQRGNVAVNGPLGIGKTSLLRYVAEPEIAAAHGVAPPAFGMVYIDIQSVSPFSTERFWRRAVQLVARQPGLDVGAAAERLLDRPELDVIDIEEFLDTLAERGTAIVLLMDELEWSLQADSPGAEAESRNFLAQLASLARRAPRVLALVVCTEAPLSEATRVIEGWRGSPFATIFTSVTLKPLSPEDADALIERAMGQGPLALGDTERRRLYALSGGEPAVLQAAAFALFHGLSQGHNAAQLWEAAQLASAQAHAALGPAGNGHAADAAHGRSTRGVWIDHATGEVQVDGRRVESLTALEYSLLRLLHGNPSRLCSKEDIIRQVWGEEFMGADDDSRVEKLISRLRRKIEPVPSRPQYIRTVRGRGYRYVP